MSDQKTPEETKHFFSEWLEKLQQESWQLELLISGFVLFGLAQSYDYIIDLINEFQKLSIQGNAGGVVFICLMGLMYFWRIFFINLLIHVILRGLWIGTIGLRYVSGEIDFDSLNYSEPITRYLKRKIGSYDNYIEKLEKLSSLVFAYTFLLFFIFLSFIIFFIEIILLGEVVNYLSTLTSDATKPFWQFLFILIGAAFIFPAIFVFIDFITLGGLKRIKGGVFPKVYLFIYRVYSKLTFSFMYRPLLYNFIDDKFTRRFFLMSIPYFLAVTVIYDGIKMNSYSFLPFLSTRHSDSQINPDYYDNLRTKFPLGKGLDRINSISLISLESVEMTEPYLSFFIKIYDVQDGKYLRHIKKIYDYRPHGLRHFLMRKKEVDSTLITTIYEERDAELLDFFVRKKDARSKGDTTDWEKEQQALERKWQDAESSYFKEKQTLVYNALWELVNIRIDCTDFTDQTYRKYSVHEYNSEHGFRCRIRLDSLPRGEHLLHLTRKLYNEDFLDSLEVRHLSIPFYN